MSWHAACLSLTQGTRPIVVARVGRKAMKIKKLLVSTAVGLAIAGTAVPSIAGDLETFGHFNFREVRGGDQDRPLNWVEGDFFSIGLNVRDTDTEVAPPDAIVKAKNDATGEVIILDRTTNTEYFKRIPYTAENAAGSWTVEIISNQGNLVRSLPAYGTGEASGAHPLVENLESSGTGTTRTLTWDLPAGVSDGSAVGNNTDRLRARLHDSNGRQLADERRFQVLVVP